MAVLSEFLYRLINVAVPEVDVGEDVFVVKEQDEAVTRVQVKHSKADGQQNGSYVAQFFLPWEQFDRPDDTPALVYVLAVRYADRWTDFIVVRRSILLQHPPPPVDLIDAPRVYERRIRGCARGHQVFARALYVHHAGLRQFRERPDHRDPRVGMRTDSAVHQRESRHRIVRHARNSLKRLK